MRAPHALSIAGSDPSGGAGIQADIKTFAAFGCYGMAAVTALTAQNTRGVLRMAPVNPELVGAQIDAIFADISVDAVKIGMLAQPRIALSVAQSLRRARAKAVVVDPVLAATQGAPLAERDLAQAILAEIAPLATLLTPNLAEAAALTHSPIAQNVEEMTAQARMLVARGARAVLVKGGHLAGDPVDILLTDNGLQSFPGTRVHTRHTHGTGCALSAAIAAELAHGRALFEAITCAKRWLEGALRAGAAGDIGAGAGAPDHFWEFRR